MKHKRRYAKTTMSEIKKNLTIGDTPEKLRAEFPKELVALFVKLCNSGFDEKVHKKYAVQAEIFLGNKFKEKTEQGKLIVRLTNATFDLVEKKHGKKEKEKEEVESEGTKELACNSCSQQTGLDGGKQEEGRKQEEMQKG